MKAVILSCSTLTDHVRAAQKKCHTDYPVVWLDRNDHAEPSRMREHILKALKEMPEDVDTVLVAMGFCGGSWQDVCPDKRVVIPRVDDCVSLVMTVTDEVNPCTKEPGHMYVFGGDAGGFSIDGLYQGLLKEHDPEIAGILFDMYFDHYRHVDIVDTGLYDCYDPDYVTSVQKQADRIKGELDFVPGSNRLLEKLVSGNWDAQFHIAEPGENITQGRFFSIP